MFKGDIFTDTNFQMGKSGLDSMTIPDHPSAEANMNDWRYQWIFLVSAVYKQQTKTYAS